MRYFKNNKVKIYCKMDNIFLVAGIISIIFFIAKFLEMRYVDKESKPLKLLIKDTLLVFVSIITGNFIYEQLTPIISNNMVESKGSMPAAAFTDDAPF
jgi:hypothetical protein